MAGKNRDKSNGKGNEKKWPDRYLKEMATLRQEIGEKERKGVNVSRAWRLFGIARKLDRKEDVEKAFDYMEKVRGDLAWKEKLFDYSTRTVTLLVAYGVPIIIALPLIGYIVAKCGFGFDLFADKPLVLGIPVFIVAWGYVGSAAYVLISIGQKMTKRLFNRREMLEYSYRMILGGVLAGIIFYVIQLGFVSLPGTAGEEINAALERGGAPAKYREYVAEKNRLTRDNYKINNIINEFKSAKPTTDYWVAKSYDTNGFRSKANLLLRYVEEWRGLRLECTYNDSDYFKGEITNDKIRKALNEAEIGYILESFIIIRDSMIPDKLIQYEANEYKLAGIEKDIANIKYHTESAFIEDDIVELDNNIGHLYEELINNRFNIIDYNNDIQTIESEYTTTTEELYIININLGYLNNNIATIENENEDIKTDIEEIENEKSELENKRDEAQKREAEKPVWESAVFIVIAFFSGYSINFVTKMFDRAMTAMISGKPGETELEGDVPPEPEAGGEEAVG